MGESERTPGDLEDTVVGKRDTAHIKQGTVWNDQFPLSDEEHIVPCLGPRDFIDRLIVPDDKIDGRGIRCQGGVWNENGTRYDHQDSDEQGEMFHAATPLGLTLGSFQPRIIFLRT